ncbi:MAG: FAD-dependent monooxygenase [Methanomassiliicoccales archaeon]|jgi:anaerobic glycerol-3-phosphate dehydrogenase|nr:FAD-dependent monooxygenase [Methanomassiliicoccales archaeon]
MRKTLEAETDVLIVGHGAAGLFSGAILSSLGKRVMIVGEGATSTSLSTGNIIFLRDLDGNIGEHRFTETTISEELLSHVANDHLDVDSINAEMLEMTSFLLPRLNSCGLAFDGSIGKKQVLLTNAGFPYSCTFAQLFASKGNLERMSERDVALLGLLGYKDFDPDLAAIVMSKTMDVSNVSAYWTDISTFQNQYEIHASEVAHLACDNTFGEQLAEAIKNIDCDMIGIPPIFPLPGYQLRMMQLEKETGREIFEVVTPLSIPGSRLHEALRVIARKEGCLISEGLKVSNLHIAGRRAESAILKSRFIETKVRFNCIMVCTGGLLGGGLIAKGKAIADPFGIFQVEKMPNSYRINTGRASQSLVQTIAQYGLKTDSLMHLYLKNGGRLENVLGAGSVLEGCSFPAGLGLGGILLTAWLSAKSAMEVLN